MASAVCIGACDTDVTCMGSCATAAVNPVASAGVTVFDVLGTLLLLMASAMFSGLTLGVMGLDVGQLELKMTAGTPEEKMQAEKILPIRRRGNLLLCTLLLGNTCVNAGIAILSASMVSGVVGSLVGPAFILIFGEIIPQSVCSRYGLAAGAKMADITRLCILLFFPFAFPLSKALDYLLGDEIGSVYTKKQLKELIIKQTKSVASRKGDGGTSDRHASTNGPSIDDKVARAFYDFDANKSGFLDYSELQNALRHYGLSDALIRDPQFVARQYENAPDGKLDLREFADLVRDLEAGVIRTDQGKIGVTEATFMCGVLSLSERRADEIMTPINDVFALYSHERLDFPLMSRIYSSGFTRMPVFRYTDGLEAERPNDRGFGIGAGAAGAGAPSAAAPAASAAAAPASSDAEERRQKVTWTDEAAAAEPVSEEAAAAAANWVASSEISSSGANGAYGSSGDGAAGEGADGAVGADSSTGRPDVDDSRPREIVGLLSAKDLILVDPEDALSVEQMVTFCGREVRARGSLDTYSHALCPSPSPPLPPYPPPLGTSPVGAGDARRARHAGQQPLPGLYARQLAPRLRAPQDRAARARRDRAAEGSAPGRAHGRGNRDCDGDRCGRPLHRHGALAEGGSQRQEGAHCRVRCDQGSVALHDRRAGGQGGTPT
jgi:hypothetical protein